LKAKPLSAKLTRNAAAAFPPGAMRRDAFVWFHRIEFSSSQLVSTDPFRVLEKFLYQAFNARLQASFGQPVLPIEILRPDATGWPSEKR